MRTRLVLLAGVLLLARPPAVRGAGLEPVDYDTYYELLPEMKAVSDRSMASLRTLHKLMEALKQEENDTRAAGIRAQIRQVLLDHRALKIRMTRLVDRILRKKKSSHTDLEVLRILRTTTLKRVSWNNQFLKYVARDISREIGVPIRLNAKVQELNQIQISFPEITAEGVLNLICENFDLKWIIYEGEVIVVKKLGPNEERFLAWEKKHGKVDWIAEDEAGTYEDLGVKEAKRKLKKLEDMDLPLLEQNMLKIYVLEGESKRHELRLKELEIATRYRHMIGEKPKTPEEEAARIKRHKHVLHYLYMERENAIEVWDVINKVLGERLVLPDDDEELRKLLAKNIEKIEWVDKDLEDALQELGDLIGVAVELDLPPYVEMTVKLSVENVTVETVIKMICKWHHLDWTYARGKLIFSHLQAGGGR